MKYTIGDKVRITDQSSGLDITGIVESHSFIYSFDDGKIKISGVWVTLNNSCSYEVLEPAKKPLPTMLGTVIRAIEWHERSVSSNYCIIMMKTRVGWVDISGKSVRDDLMSSLVTWEMLYDPEHLIK